MNYHDYKQECRKRYGDPNYIYLNRYVNNTKSSILVVDAGDRDTEIYMYPHQEEWRERRGITMAEYEVKEMALQMLAHLGYDVFLREMKDSERWGDKTEQGFEWIPVFHEYKNKIVQYLKVNPPNPSMICSIANGREFECFEDTEHLVRVYQMMIDAKQLIFNKELGAFALNPNLFKEK